MPVISGVDLVIAVEGRTCADFNLNVTAVRRRVGGGADAYGGVNVNDDGGSAGGSSGDVDVTAVGVELVVASTSPLSEVVQVVALVAAWTSPQSEVELVVLLVVASALT